MNDAVILDSDPLGEWIHPRLGSGLREWARRLLEQETVFVAPEIADYELRRELIRGGMNASVERLDLIGSLLRYEPLNTAVMRLAARLWTASRRGGRPTSPDPALDADVILAAHTLHYAETSGLQVIVATTNPRHIGRFVPAANWTEIAPL